MHLLFRTLLRVLFFARRGSRLGLHDVARARFVTLPTDLDVNRHMNNGVFLSIMDLARMDQFVRTGIFDLMRSRGWSPVVASETIAFRKPLGAWRRFTIETRLVGHDEKVMVFEQRFVRPSRDGGPEIYARAFVRKLLVRRTGGAVRFAELVDALGIDPAEADERRPPEWVERWGEEVALPPRRSEAPSTWE
ncbi:acyl-CoA thioesterase [Agromyces kandeliae]|uniref:4-hydroxybenzoyl-CoA thioesterase n=1 Tax=Agromyces kandeliae TaxID=2666141 RepID=A0A6L5R2C3_9MICO|nr:thioesterase family protein [Agromyces kandeliae]MRX44035.1 4-hydroxybenzoyl-CoA thioesterase [Agromyces kandeliae]